jgi:short-subunit dehydrogenase
MTEGMKLPPALTAKPDAVGAAIVRAVNKRRNVIYVLPVWAVIMTIIKLIPESVFKRTRS